MYFELFVIIKLRKDQQWNESDRPFNMYPITFIAIQFLFFYGNCSRNWDINWWVSVYGHIQHKNNIFFLSYISVSRTNFKTLKEAEIIIFKNCYEFIKHFEALSLHIKLKFRKRGVSLARERLYQISQNFGYVCLTVSGNMYCCDFYIHMLFGVG